MSFLDHWSLSHLWNVYLSTSNRTQADAKRNLLLEKHLQAIMVRIIARKFGISARSGTEPFPATDHIRYQAAEVLSEAQAKALVVMEQHWSARHNPTAKAALHSLEPVRNIENYMARLASHAFHAYLDEKNPSWRSMKHAVLYLLKSRPLVLRLDRVGNHTYCSLPEQSSWLNQNPDFAYSSRWHNLESDPLKIAQSVVPDSEGHIKTPAGKTAAIVRVLVYVGHPVRVDDMTNLLLELSNEPFLTPSDENEDYPLPNNDLGDPLERVPSKRLTPEQELVFKSLLDRHWKAFCRLKSSDMKRTLALTWKTYDEAELSFMHLLAEWQVVALEPMAHACEWEESYWKSLWPRLAFAYADVEKMLNKSNGALRVQHHAALGQIKKEVGLWN